MSMDKSNMTKGSPIMKMWGWHFCLEIKYFCKFGLHAKLHNSRTNPSWTKDMPANSGQYVSCPIKGHTEAWKDS